MTNEPTGLRWPRNAAAPDATTLARAQMAQSFADAIERCAKLRGYAGCLLEPSEEVPTVSKLYEYVARYAYAHRAEDVAGLVRMAGEDHAELERHLLECIGILNVHHNIGVAVAEVERARQHDARRSREKAAPVGR